MEERKNHEDSGRELEGKEEKGNERGGSIEYSGVFTWEPEGHSECTDLRQGR